MKKFFSSITVTIIFLLGLSITGKAQTTITFEGIASGETSFSGAGINFSITPGSGFFVENISNFGYLSSSCYIDNYNSSGDSPGSITYKITGNNTYSVDSLYIYPSTYAQGNFNQTIDVGITLVGKLSGTQVYSYSPPSSLFTSALWSDPVNKGFSLVDMSVPGYQNKVIDELDILVTGTTIYFAIDNFTITSASVTTPTVTTTAISTFNSTSATMGGNVTADGGANITDRGVVYSLASANTNPQIGGTGVTKVAIGTGNGTFSQSIGSLTPSTLYYVNSYATNSAGTSYGTVTNFTTLPPAPTITGISPDNGPTAGNTSVTITGTNLASATAVQFGGTSATITGNTATQITATSPAHSAGTVDITVTTAGGTSATSVADQFTYVAPPTITNISPNSGPTAGATSVTITGTNLSLATSVQFGVTTASFAVNSSTQITATSPAHSAATIDITVTTTGGTSATGSADQFTYVAAPTVTGVSPASGPTTGNTSVTITGTNLLSASAVQFGAATATITGNTSTQITATSPAHSAGTVDITVTTAGGTSATASADQFTYGVAPAAPTISGIAAGIFNSNQTFTVSGEAGTTIEYSTNNGGLWSAYSGAVTLSAEGTFNVLARQTSLAGYGTTASALITLTIDKTAPAAPTISGISAGYFNTNQTFTVSGEAGAAIEYSTNNGGLWSAYSGAVTISAAGTYNILARQTDQAGNGPVTSATITVIIDKTAPAEPTISGISAGLFNTNQTFTVSGEAGATIQYSINNGGLWTAYGGAVTISTDGTYNVLARQTDQAGNGPTSSAVITFTIDKTAPAAPTITGISAGYFNTNQTFTVSGEAGASIEYSTNNGGLWSAYSGAVTLSGEGTYNVLARQTDQAGNGPTSSAAITLTIDKTAPAAPTISGISAGNFTNNQTFTVSGEAGATIEYSVNNGGLWVAYSGAVTLSVESTYNVLARQTDQAGNGPVSSAVITLIIDKSAPATQASSIVFSAAGLSQMTIGWTNGNGVNRAVFVKAANSGTASPADNTTYSPNTIFASGTQIALTGWYCVFNGAGTSVTVSGLTSATDYIAQVFEYRGTAGSEIYNTNTAADNPKSQATLMVAPTNLSYAASPVVATINTTNISASPSVTGTVVSYSISPALPTGVSLNTSTGVISGTPSVLLVLTDFTVTATNTGGSTNATFRLTVNGFAPTVTTQAVSDVTTITATGHGNITNLGVPNPTEYGVVWNTAANPTTALTTKTTQGAAGATGAFTSNITNLSPWTTYYVKAYATNTEGTSYGAEVSFTTIAVAASTQTSSITFSSVQHSQFTITCTKGNGARRAIFVKEGTGAITNPADNTSYTASNDWAVKGTQLGASNYFCVYNDTGKTVTVINILPTTQYTVQIFEYNGPAGGEKYNTTTAAYNPAVQTTTPLPPVAAAATLITSYGFNANWNPAAGAASYQLDVALNNTFLNIVPAYNGINVGNVTTFPVTGLLGSTQYFYRLRSVNIGGAGTNSNIIDQLTNQAIIAKDTTVTPNSFIVKWDPVSDAVDYFLDYSTENNFTRAVSSPNPNPLVLEKENNSASTSSSYLTIAVGNATSYILTGLTANTTYYYRVRAANSFGIVISTSNPLSATTGIQSVNNSRYTLTAPDAKTRWQSGTCKYIEWKRSGIVYGTILLEYSIDGGENWIKINSQPIAGASRYPWLVPNANSTNCLIRMTNYVTHSLFDITGSFFEIYTASAGAVNYPNPFNPSTKIKFSIESKGDVLLKVYNSLGEEVAVLVNGELEAGAHEYEFNAAKLTSGIYFYNLRVNGNSETHKMLLIK